MIKMPREIEFRAWLKDEKRMIDVRAIDFDDDGNILSVNYPEGKSYSGYDGDNIELMQYTGIKDKNGVKIFEGDIVIYKYQNDDLKTKKLTVFFDEEDCSFSLAYKGKPHMYVEKDDAKYYKVIGNIYENKELLENE